MDNPLDKAPVDYQCGNEVCFIRSKGNPGLLGLYQKWIRVKDDQYVFDDWVWVRVPTIEL